MLHIYLLVLIKITVPGWRADDAAKQTEEKNERVFFKNCAPFIKCISRIRNTWVDDAQKIDVILSMCNLSESSDISWHSNIRNLEVYGKKYNRDEANNILANSESFRFKLQITTQNPDDVPLKYFSNFWRTLWISPNSCESSLNLTWSAAWVISNSTVKGRFAITDRKHYVPVVTISTQDNAKLLEQLKYGFKGAISWNEYLPRNQ